MSWWKALTSLGKVLYVLLWAVALGLTVWGFS